MTERPLMLSPSRLDLPTLTRRARLAEQFGVTRLWMEQVPYERDNMVVAAHYLEATQRVTVGTAVLPVYHRHPVAMAQTALSLAERYDGRFVLGLGAGHPTAASFTLGEPAAGPPLQVMSEYVTIVRQLVEQGSVMFEGEHYAARLEYRPPRRPVPIHLAALGPRMTRLAVRIADGMLLHLCSAEYIEQQVMPVVRAACAEIGRDPATFPVVAIVTAYAGPDAEEYAAVFRRVVNGYRSIPVYRRVIDAQRALLPVPAGGATTRGDVSTHLGLIGTAEHVRAGIERYRAAGCIPAPGPMGDDDEDFVGTVAAIYGD